MDASSGIDFRHISDHNQNEIALHWIRHCVRTAGHPEGIHFDGLSPTHRSARSWANSRDTGFEDMCQRGTSRIQ